MHLCGIFRQRRVGLYDAWRTPLATLICSSLRLICTYWMQRGLFNWFTLQAVPRLLDCVQSHTGLKDSHRYPTLTRCHCRDPVITISAPHETFMDRWQWWPGKHPNFQRRACHILLFQGLVTCPELLIKLYCHLRSKQKHCYMSFSPTADHKRLVQVDNSRSSVMPFSTHLNIQPFAIEQSILCDSAPSPLSLSLLLLHCSLDNLQNL